MFLITVSPDGFCIPAFFLIVVPLKGYDEPEILLSQLAQFCLIGADAGQASDEKAKALSGGMSLLPVIKQKLAHPSGLVDLSEIPDMRGIEIAPPLLRIGALTTHAVVAADPILAVALPALSTVAGGIGDVQVRHRGTIGGSIANNDPSADYPAACLALDAIIVTDRREIAAGDFFVGMFETALRPDELVVRVDFRVADQAAYCKFRHPISRYALVGIFVARFGKDVRVAVTGAGASVFRMPEFEAALTVEWSEHVLAPLTVDDAELSADIHASSAYRAHMIRHLAMQAVGHSMQLKG